jgi:SAM-dependent methyltransferase/Zn ribbon nucleic-acid-binding protein
MDFEARACPICGCADRLVLYREANLDLRRLTDATFSSRKLPEYMHPRLDKCLRCGLVFANPSPSSASLEGLYREASFAAAKESQFAAKTYVRYLRRAKGLTPVPTVDIGAGDGAFLAELARNGFQDVIGFEPSEAPIAVADPIVREHLRAEFFDASSFANDQVGLVTCFQTIEHVYDPLQLTTGMFRILRPGGVAFLIAHNVDSLSAKILGGKSPIFDIEHLQLFNRESALTLMRSSGFSDISVFPIYNTYPLTYWIKLLPIAPGLKTHVLSALEGPLAQIGAHPVSLPAGNLGIIATK